MAIWLKFKGYIIAFTGALMGLWGIYMYGRHSGALDTQMRQERAN